MMNGFKIQELRAAVLSDLREFIPEGYYSFVRTDEDVAFGDITLAKRLQEKQYKTPQLTPRQLAAVWLLERIGLYCHKYESADPAADAAEGITPESIKEMRLEHLHDALRRYTAYNGADEARAHLMPADVPAAVKQAAPDVVDTTSKKNDQPPGITAGMVTITKLAITAAWEIEREIKRKATVKEVIERLQGWVTSKRYAELIEIIPHGVKWMTTAPDEKPYDIDACRATLKTWHTNLKKSRA